MFDPLELLFGDNRGAMPIKAGVTLIVGLLIIGLLASVLLPEAVNNTVQVDTSSWGSIETTLWDLLPMAYILGVFLFVIALAVAQF